MTSKYRPKMQINLGRVMADQGGLNLYAQISEAITATTTNRTLGAAPFAGSVKNVWISVGASGKDDAQPLSIEANVKINGTDCLSTNPRIAHVSGEVSQQKTTYNSLDTGITEAVLNTSVCTFNAGDVFTYGFEIVRTPSPTTEIQAPCLVVELLPAK